MRLPDTGLSFAFLPERGLMEYWIIGQLINPIILQSIDPQLSHHSSIPMFQLTTFRG